MGDNARRLIRAHRFALPRTLHPLTRASAGHAPVGVVGIRGAAGAPFAAAADDRRRGAARRQRGGSSRRPPARPGRRRARSRACWRARGCPRVWSASPTTPLDGCARLLELGGGLDGPDAMIVLADANLEHAIEGALWAAMRRSGAARRVAQAGLRRRGLLLREFVEGLSQAASELELGDALAARHPARTAGRRGVAATLEAAIEEAVAFGAVVFCGGRRSLAAGGGDRSSRRRC